MNDYIQVVRCCLVIFASRPYQKLARCIRINVGVQRSERGIMIFIQMTDISIILGYHVPIQITYNVFCVTQSVLHQ